MDSNIFNSLVRIQSQGYEFNWLEPFKNLSDSVGIGTGFFINKEGYVLTCAHVISNSVKLWVSIPSNGMDKYDAEIISFYPEIDIAIIKVLNYNKKIEYLELDNSDKISPGEDVIAVGYPLGQDKLKVTKGIISGREMGLIQTDTPLNPGNSGGPLLNNSKKVVGINSSAYSSEDAENVGFAIPINLYKHIEDTMLEGVKKLIFKPSLGCLFYNSNEDILKFYNCNQNCSTGVLVQGILHNSDLRNKGIEKGDILCQLDKYNIDNYSECKVDWNVEKVPISSIIERYKPEDKINMIFWSQKKNKILQKDIKIKSTQQIYAIREKYPLFERIEWEIFGGFVMVELTLNHIELLPYLMKYINPERRNKKRVVITQIYPGSSLSKSLILQPGNVIKKINNIEVNTIEEIRKAIIKPLKKNNKDYLKIEDDDNKIAIFLMERLINENLFLSQNFNYPITDFNNTLLMKYHKNGLKKTVSKRKKNIKTKKTHII